jgi:hypothetical protein
LAASAPSDLFAVNDDNNGKKEAQQRSNRIPQSPQVDDNGWLGSNIKEAPSQRGQISAASTAMARFDSVFLADLQILLS